MIGIRGFAVAMHAFSASAPQNSDGTPHWIGQSLVQKMEPGTYIVTCCISMVIYTVHVYALVYIYLHLYNIEILRRMAAGIIAQEEATVSCFLEAIVSNNLPGSCCHQRPPSLPASE